MLKYTNRIEYKSYQIQIVSNTNRIKYKTYQIQIVSNTKSIKYKYKIQIVSNTNHINSNTNFYSFQSQLNSKTIKMISQKSEDKYVKNVD